MVLYLLHRDKIDEDLQKYSADGVGLLPFIKVCTRQRVFRNLFYYRMGEYRSVFIKWMLPPERTLYIWCPHIGRGCHFEHNYATYLNAESIGEAFWGYLVADCETEKIIRWGHDCLRVYNKESDIHIILSFPLNHLQVH